MSERRLDEEATAYALQLTADDQAEGLVLTDMQKALLDSLDKVNEQAGVIRALTDTLNAQTLAAGALLADYKKSVARVEALEEKVQRLIAMVPEAYREGFLAEGYQCWEYSHVIGEWRKEKSNGSE